MSQTEQRQCVYCLATKVYGVGKSKKFSEFNSEHVLHRSVASGYKNAPTLNGRVCITCNQHFGDSIDLVFGRTGYEGLQRFKHGLKNTSELHHLQSGGLVFGSAAPGIQDFVPVDVEHYVAPQGTVGTKVEPYLMFYSRKRNQKLKVTRSEIPHIWKLILEHDLDANSITFASNGLQAEEDELIKLLKQEGIDVLYSSSPSIPAPLLVSAYTPSTESLRAVAKIAFNYFAYLCEDLDPSIALSEDFNLIRDYIRHDGQYTDMVLSGEGLMLGAATDHTCCLQYSESDGQSLTIVHVSLFNGFTYSFVLSRNPIGKSFPEAQSHQWNVEAKNFGRVPLNLLWAASLLTQARLTRKN
jgi:hypothetical protein